MIAKSHERTMTKYFERFVKDDPNVNKEAIGWSLNVKHTKIAKIFNLNPKWMITKDDIDRQTQLSIYGEGKWNFLE